MHHRLSMVKGLTLLIATAFFVYASSTWFQWALSSLNVKSSIRSTIYQNRGLICDQPAFDFGAIPVGQSADHTFWLFNSSNEQHRILDVSVGCDCVKIMDFPQLVEAHHWGAVRVTIPTSNSLGERRSTILVESVGSRKQFVSLEFSCQVTSAETQVAKGHTITSPIVNAPIEARNHSHESIELGAELEIVGPTLDGSNANILEFRGKPVIVVFWASWCGYCKREIPQIVNLQEEYGTGFHVVGVNMDREKELGAAACKQLEVPWQNIHFSRMTNESAANPLSTRYQIRGVPMILVADGDGKLVGKGRRLDELAPLVRDLVDREIRLR